MNYYGNSVTRLVEEFSKLPGIGKRSAQRLAFYVLGLPLEKAEALSEAIISARKSISYCSSCCNLTENDPCLICSNKLRNHGLIMVVEDPRDMAAYEKTREFKGVYHILHGAISPMNGIGPADLKIKELLLRIQALEDKNDGENAEPAVQEVIIATNPNVEGEATAMYLSKLLKPLGVLVTRIAHGVPVGGDLEHVDEATLSRALENRRAL